MAKPTKPATTAPAAATPTPSPVAPASVEKQLYYRINKISGHLAELFEVEVDESANPPRRVGKQDLPAIIQDKAMPHLFPSVDDLDKRRRAKEKASK